MYKITDYTKTKARDLGVSVANSTNPKKKLDVYKSGEKVASIGAAGYNDYPTFLKLYGKEYADKRKTLYKKRHAKDLHIVGSNDWYANKLLW